MTEVSKVKQKIFEIMIFAACIELDSNDSCSKG